MAYRTVSLILTLPNFSWRSGCLQSCLKRRIERASTELFKVSCAVVCSELSMRSATTLRMPLARISVCSPPLPEENGTAFCGVGLAASTSCSMILP